MADETLTDTTAPEEGQPVEEAVSADAPVESPVEESVESASPVTEEQPAHAARLFAGKYQSPEDLERAYLESQREASRMAGELSAYKRNPQPSTSAEPKWKQLEAERNKWSQYYRSPNLTEQERYNADEQIRLHDREIAYERAKHDLSQQTQRQTAESQLEQEARGILQQYSNDLNNTSSQLYQTAAQRYQSLVQAGYPDSDATKALAVTYAAALTRTNVSQAVQQDRGKMLKTLNTAVKKAVVAGAGGPAPSVKKGVTAEDISKMSDAEFARYERGLLGV